MNQPFLEKLLENKHFFESLIEIDAHVMNIRYTSDTITAYIESLLVMENQKEIIINPNSLVLSDGNPLEIIKFLAFLNPDTHFILFPNYSFMGLNTLFVKVFNLVYGDVCILSKEKNYNCYLSIKDAFPSIYILGKQTIYQEMKNDFPKSFWISI